MNKLNASLSLYISLNYWKKSQSDSILNKKSANYLCPFIHPNERERMYIIIIMLEMNILIITRVFFIAQSI